MVAVPATVPMARTGWAAAAKTILYLNRSVPATPAVTEVTPRVK